MIIYLFIYRLFATTRWRQQLDLVNATRGRSFSVLLGFVFSRSRRPNKKITFITTRRRTPYRTGVESGIVFHRKEDKTVCNWERRQQAGATRQIPPPHTHTTTTRVRIGRPLSSGRRNDEICLSLLSPIVLEETYFDIKHPMMGRSGTETHRRRWEPARVPLGSRTGCLIKTEAPSGHYLSSQSPINNRSANMPSSMGPMIIESPSTSSSYDVITGLALGGIPQS